MGHRFRFGMPVGHWKDIGQFCFVLVSSPPESQQGLNMNFICFFEFEDYFENDACFVKVSLQYRLI